MFSDVNAYFSDVDAETQKSMAFFHTWSPKSPTEFFYRIAIGVFYCSGNNENRVLGYFLKFTLTYNRHLSSLKVCETNEFVLYVETIPREI